MKVKRDWRNNTIDKSTEHLNTQVTSHASDRGKIQMTTIGEGNYWFHSENTILEACQIWSLAPWRTYLQAPTSIQEN